MDLSSLTGMFVGVHAMIAMQTNTPELMIQPDEGAAFMAAAQNVMRHYSVEATQKTIDWLSLAGIAGGMYLTRGVAIANRLAAEKAQAKAEGTVMQFRRRGKPPASHLAEVPPTAPGGQAGELVAGPTPDITLDPFGSGGFQPEEAH